MKKCTLLLILVLIISSCGEKKVELPESLIKRTEMLQSLDSHRWYAPGELLPDLEVLRTSLREAHAGLYDWNTQETIDARFAEMEQIAAWEGGVNYLTWLDQIARLTVEIGDAQTTWSHNPNYISFRNENIAIAPFELGRRDDAWVIQRDFTHNRSLPIGAEIFSMDGKSMDAYLELNRPLLPIQYDNHAMQKAWLEEAFPKHHSNFWSQAAGLELQFTDGKKVLAVTETAAVLEERGASEVFPELPVTYTSDDDVHTLVFNSFEDDPSLPGPGVDATLDQVFSILNGQDKPSLIMDMRGVRKAKVKQMVQLLSYFFPEPFEPLDTVIKTPVTTLTHDVHAKATLMLSPKYLFKLQDKSQQSPWSYDGSVHIITDGETSGEIGLFLSRMASRPNTFFVGEQASVPAWGMHHGHFVIALPISQIRYVFPTTRLITQQEKLGTRELVRLDHPIPVTSSDVLEKVSDLARTVE